MAPLSPISATKAEKWADELLETMSPRESYWTHRAHAIGVHVRRNPDCVICILNDPTVATVWTPIS